MGTKLPGIEGRRDVATPQRRVKGYSTAANERANRYAVEGYESAAGAIEDISADRKDRLDEEKREYNKNLAAGAQDRENRAQLAMQDVLYGDGEKEGLYHKKGQYALNVEGDYNKSWNTVRSAALKDFPNGAARTALESSLDSMHITNRGNAKRFAHNEGKVFQNKVSSTRGEIAQNKIGVDYLNDEGFANNLASMKNAAVNASRANGDPAIMQEQARNAAGSSAYETRIMAMYNSNDSKTVARAASLYDGARGRGDLNFDAVTRIDKHMDKLVPMIMAKEAMSELAKPSSFDNVDNIYASLLNVESGNKHYDKAGKIITSKAGAKGISQLMKPTALEMEKELGLTEGSWLSPEGNKEIGKAYLDKQIKYYNDPTLGVLSYNWGMGNVNKHIKKVGDPREGEITMDKFLSTIDNDEARAYVPKVLSGMSNDAEFNRATVVKRANELEADYIGAGAELIDMYDAQEKQKAATLKADRDKFEDGIHEKVAKANGDYTVLTAGEREKATELGIDYTKYVGVSIDETVAELNALPAQQFLDIDLNNPRIVKDLTYDDLQEMKKKQKDLLKPENKAMKDLVTGAVDYYFDVQDLKEHDNAANKIKRGDMTEYIMAKSQLMSKGGKVPTKKDIYSFASEWHTSNKKAGKLYGQVDIKYTDIPVNEREIIESALLEKNITPTAEMVLTLYSQNRQVDKEVVEEDEVVIDNNLTGINGMLQSYLVNPFLEQIK